MNVTFPCPKCDAANRTDVDATSDSIDCAHCGQVVKIPPGSVDEGRVTRCLACPSVDLFVRKDFPQGLGVTIVTIGLLGSCVAWAFGYLYWTFAILFGTALVDVLLYALVPNALMCYRCGAMYRGVRDMQDHSSFNLETHEKHRQQKIRLADAQRTAAWRESTAVRDDDRQHPDNAEGDEPREIGAASRD